MVRNWSFALSAVLVLALASSARSSGCCDETPTWKLKQTLFNGYNNSVVMVPGNDSRVNLALLLADSHAPGGLRLAATANPVDAADPAPLFQWTPFRDSMIAPDNVNERISGSGSRCDSNVSGNVAFEAALNADRTVAAAEKSNLIAMRRAMQPKCAESAAQPNAALDTAVASMTGAAAPFGQYLQGAQAFYDGRFTDASARFAALTGARNGWLKETALYMVARTALNGAQANACDEYGTLIAPEKRDKAAITAAETAFQTYLRAYPKGDYAVSARGLLRRVYWLAGDRDKLSAEYRKLFALSDAAQRGIDDFKLAEEIDQKLLPGLTHGETTEPVLLAVSDLMRMRGKGDEYASYCCDKPITQAEIDGQRALFADSKPLYDYVAASFALYVANKPADVLRMIPDAAKQRGFSHLQFSRQMLRGFALDAVRDPNARGFWLEMIGGATQPYQRQAVELALAMHEERSGGLARVFAADSQIRSTNIRGILLAYGAGPDLLRQQARNASVPQRERDAALFLLLYKQVSRGFYGAFLNDVRLVGRDAPDAAGDFGLLDYRGLYDAGDTRLPLGLFTTTRNVGDFGCAPLLQSVGLLAKNARATTPRLCVAEFMRVNGFDHFAQDVILPNDELGGAPSLFPGKPYSRLEVYKDIIADAAAPAEDKAYALYRAVHCYAPAGINDCGGTEVEKPQRRAWFLRLKRDYPQSKWAKSDLYW